MHIRRFSVPFLAVGIAALAVPHSTGANEAEPSPQIEAPSAYLESIENPTEPGADPGAAPEANALKTGEGTLQGRDLKSPRKPE
jgi:hypothetical protein